MKQWAGKRCISFFHFFIIKKKGFEIERKSKRKKDGPWKGVCGIRCSKSVCEAILWCVRAGTRRVAVGGTWATKHLGCERKVLSRPRCTDKGERFCFVSHIISSMCVRACVRACVWAFWLVIDRLRRRPAAIGPALAASW